MEGQYIHTYHIIYIYMCEGLLPVYTNSSGCLWLPIEILSNASFCKRINPNANEYQNISIRQCFQCSLIESSYTLYINIIIVSCLFISVVVYYFSIYL